MPLTRAPFALPKDVVETCSGAISTAALAPGVLVAGTIYVGRVWPEKDQALTKIAWGNGAAVAGNVEAGVLTYDGTTWTRVGTTGAVAQAGVTQKQEVTGLSIQIYRALPTYLFLIPSDGSTAQFYGMVNAHSGMNSVSASGVRAGTKASVNQPCPATITGIATDIRTVWIAGYS